MAMRNRMVVRVILINFFIDCSASFRNPHISQVFIGHQCHRSLPLFAEWESFFESGKRIPDDSSRYDTSRRRRISEQDNVTRDYGGERTESYSRYRDKKSKVKSSSSEFRVIKEGDGNLPTDLEFDDVNDFRREKRSQSTRNEPRTGREYAPQRSFENDGKRDFSKNSAFGRGGRGFRSSDRAFPKANDGSRWYSDKPPPTGEHIDAKGSTAWLKMDVPQENIPTQNFQRPVWKIPKDGDDSSPIPAKKLPKLTNRENVWKRPLPKGINIELKQLSLDQLENRMRSKFSDNTKEDEEFYDQDDDGYEADDVIGVTKQEIEIQKEGIRLEDKKDLSAVTRPIKPKTSILNEAVAAAKEGGFIMRARPTASSTSDEDDAAKKSGTEVKSKTSEEDQFNVEYLRHLTLESLGYVDPHVDDSFEDVGIANTGLLSNLGSMGMAKPTHVQASSIKELLNSSNDVIIHAHTGSGKTLAFLLPLLQRIDISSDHIQAVVIAPGRELGSQIYNVAQQLVEGTGIKTQMIIGGANVNRQIDRLKANKPHVLIGTPGRVCELALEKKRVKLGNVSFLVLDEVDTLMRPPYNEEIDNVIKTMRSSDYRLTVFASATGKSPTVEKAAVKHMKEGYAYVTGGSGANFEGLPPNIAHTVLTCAKVKKFESLKRIMNSQPFPASVMVFVNDPHQVRWLTEKLETVGIIAAPLSGDSVKEDRSEIMKRLTDGRLGMVVTTEMAARGIDVPQLTHVINYDLPTDSEHYVHRAGRCGRAGRPGIVVNVAVPETKFVLGKFRDKLGLPFEDVDVKDGKLRIIKRTKVGDAVSEGDKQSAKSDTTLGKKRKLTKRK